MANTDFKIMFGVDEVILGDRFENCELYNYPESCTENEDGTFSNYYNNSESCITTDEYNYVTHIWNTSRAVTIGPYRVGKPVNIDATRLYNSSFFDFSMLDEDFIIKVSVDYNEETNQYYTSEIEAYVCSWTISLSNGKKLYPRMYYEDICNILGSPTLFDGEKGVYVWYEDSYKVILTYTDTYTELQIAGDFSFGPLTTREVYETNKVYEDYPLTAENENCISLVLEDLQMTAYLQIEPLNLFDGYFFVESVRFIPYYDTQQN